MDDKEIFGLIECFRGRLRKLIIVEPLMDLLHFLEDDDKELIRVRINTQGNMSAVDQLLDTIAKGVRPQGWFKEFIDALETVGCAHAASYIINSPPNPSLEDENDSCVKLIKVLQPSLERMKTRDVCVSCYSLDILTEEDRDNIFAEIENHGSARGARLLLRRVVRNEIGWFSTFLRALQKTSHLDLVKELLGDDLVDHKGDKLSDAGSVQDATKYPEGSTQIATALLSDYMDGDAEIDLYTDPFEQVQQDVGVPEKGPAEATGAARECPQVSDRTRPVPPDGSYTQPRDPRSGGNPLSALRVQRHSSVRHYHHHHHHHALTASETLLRAALSGQCDGQEVDSEPGTDSGSDTDTDGDGGADSDADADEWGDYEQGDDGDSFSDGGSCRGSDQHSPGYLSYDDYYDDE